MKKLRWNLSPESRAVMGPRWCEANDQKQALLDAFSGLPSKKSSPEQINDLFKALASGKS